MERGKEGEGRGVGRSIAKHCSLLWYHKELSEGRKEGSGWEDVESTTTTVGKKRGRFGIRTMEISSHSSFSTSSSHTEEREKERRRRRLDPVLSPSSPFLCHGKEEERRRRSRKGDPKSEKSRDSTFSPPPRPPPLSTTPRAECPISGTRLF